MITARFRAKNEVLCGFSVSGHAGYADAGQDIVCAAVTSAVQLTINTISEVCGLKSDLSVKQNIIEFDVCSINDFSTKMLEGLRLHLQILAEDYTGTIKVIVLEV